MMTEEKQHKKKVLIVEDEKLLAGAITKVLASLEITVLLAGDGQEGLQMALGEHPDLILLDLVLPVMDGQTLLEKLRQDEWGSKVPVIILTNLSKAESIAESKEKGVSDYLVKTDWKLAEVVEKVKNELGIS